MLKGVGDQAIVASICPAQSRTRGAADYGYRPAVDAIIDKLKSAPHRPMPAAPAHRRTDDGQVSCVILEAFNTSADTGNCDQACSAA